MSDINVIQKTRNFFMNSHNSFPYLKNILETNFKERTLLNLPFFFENSLVAFEIYFKLFL